MPRSRARAAADFAPKQRMKQLLLAQLRRQAPGQGVEVPRDDPLWGAAVTELLREKPQLTVVRLREGLLLCKRVEIEAGISADVKAGMNTINAIARPGDDLNDDL